MEDERRFKIAASGTNVNMVNVMMMKKTIWMMAT
jgi:hypothetical protein